MTIGKQIPRLSFFGNRLIKILVTTLDEKSKGKHVDQLLSDVVHLRLGELYEEAPLGLTENDIEDLIEYIDLKLSLLTLKGDIPFEEATRMAQQITHWLGVPSQAHEPHLVDGFKIKRRRSAPLLFAGAPG